MANLARIEKAESRVEQAETRTEQAESRTEQAQTRTEQAETRTEQAESRTEQAKTRIEQAETRAEEAEAALERFVEEKASEEEKTSPGLPKNFALGGIGNELDMLERLTRRQREVLVLIAEGRNTKSIAALLNVSPKTVEYHRMKLMNCLNLHEISGLVRFAMQAGLVHQEKL
jgi:DNA-binding NarL/FixJ family response regulator